jgi:outer membrane protein, heavy metal efflux system
LIDTASRLRAAGQIDYISFLRTLDMAFEIENEYAAEVFKLNAAQIKMMYLAGK